MLLLPVNFQKISEKPQTATFLAKTLKILHRMEKMKQKIIWSITLISKYKSNSNTNDLIGFGKFLLFTVVFLTFPAGKVGYSNQTESSFSNWGRLLNWKGPGT